MTKNMAKGAFAVLLLLQIVCAATFTSAVDSKPTSAAVDSKPTSAAVGLKEACQKTSDPEFCTSLLRQYASEFADKDADKMGYAAISAALSRAQAARAFMVRESTNPEVPNAAKKAATKECLVKVGTGVDSLRKAAREFDEMRAAKGGVRESKRTNVVKNIKSSSNDLNACFDLLKKEQKKVGEEVIRTVGREAEEAAQASLVAQAIVNNK